MMKNYLFTLLACFIVFLIPVSSVASEDEIIELIVVQRDYLINICLKYLEDPRKWREIANINRLRNANLIYPGQKLKIPIRLLSGIPIDGEITFIKGEVKLQFKESKTWQTLKLGDRVKQGSIIKTGVESAIEVTYKDGTTFFLRPNTTLDVLTAHKGALLQIQKLFLNVGRTITKMKKSTGRESRFEIKTPSAVAAVRGTKFRVSVDIRDATRSEVLEGIVGVAAKDEEVMVRQGEGTFVKKGEPPIIPKKLLPPPALIHLKPIYKKMPFRFQFEKIKDAASYRVMFAKDKDFKDLLKEKVIKPQETLQIIGIDDGTYYLQSRSIDSMGLEGFPSKAEIIKVRVNPVPPFVQSPADGTEYKERKMTFKWLKVEDAARYHIQLAEDGEFKTILLDKDNIKEQAFKTEKLDVKTYYFRVSSIADDDYQGDWSDALRFTVIPPPPTPPIEKPKISKKEIQIRWRDLGKGITYHFQMAKDKAFEEILLDKTIEVPEITFKKPKEPGTYYVRTSGMDADGYEGDFSSPQSFEVEKRFPYKVLGVIGVIVTGGLILLL